jgi:hypothetical protein
MFLLPKGNPLNENIPTGRIRLPEVLDKLKNGGFTGYLKFVFPEAQGVLFFEAGKMISAQMECGASKLSGFEALASLCREITSGGGTFGVFRLSRDMTMCLHALLHGDVLYRGQEVKLIDIKGLLEKMKARQLNGCLRLYTDERSALIFYKDGTPLGFMHDGSEEIETSASESQKIAGLPGAKLDVLSTKSADELMHYDLMEMVNIDKLWDSAVNRQITENNRLNRMAKDKEHQEREAKLKVLEDDLREVAVAYLGRVGRSLVDKEIAELGGNAALLGSDGAGKFLTAVSRGAKLLTSMTKMKEMIDLMQKEIESCSKGS